MAWMSMMGGESVEYHRETVIERGGRLSGPGAGLLRVSG